MRCELTGGRLAAVRTCRRGQETCAERGLDDPCVQGQASRLHYGSFVAAERGLGASAKWKMENAKLKLQESFLSCILYLVSRLLAAKLCHTESVKIGQNETLQDRSRAEMPGKPRSTRDLCPTGRGPRCNGQKGGGSREAEGWRVERNQLCQLRTANCSLVPRCIDPIARHGCSLYFAESPNPRAVPVKTSAH